MTNDEARMTKEAQMTNAEGDCSKNPDVTTTVSFDYLIELSDDGTQPDGPNPEIVLPPPD